MTPEPPPDLIRRLAAETGFQACGFASAGLLSEEEERYSDWLRREQWGEMHYLSSKASQRLDPRRVMPEAKSVIALLVSYHSGVDIPSEDNYLIARYARGKDYHVYVKNMLKKMASELNARFPGALFRPFVDSGVLMEKAWAQRCGVGWRGKNTLLVNRGLGSWVFIGILLTDLELQPDPPEPDRCGTCDRCVKACPTGALEEPYRLNPLRCIAYHTIEHDREIPEEFRGRFGNRIFGCDICQEACPHNREPLINPDPAFRPVPDLVSMRKKEWESLTEEGFDRLFRGSSVRRAGYEALIRNIRFVSGADPSPALP